MVELKIKLVLPSGAELDTGEDFNEFPPRIGERLFLKTTVDNGVSYVVSSIGHAMVDYSNGERTHMVAIVLDRA